MERKTIDAKAIEYYKENVEGEPLDQDVPITCFIDGAEFVLAENKKNFKRVLKNLEPLRNSLIHTGHQGEWMRIINSLRLCAGMELIEFKNKNIKKV